MARLEYPGRFHTMAMSQDLIDKLWWTTIEGFYGCCICHRVSLANATTGLLYDLQLQKEA
jgi:hypothetical protein